ncbi:patatin-like phospholipase family protein [Dyella monticola]|uniref:Patatin-like phospholipase family protein n=2 Tax=Dyella monticola TaxID=1927958 RepID=A0A370X6B3_9GAMM|nr:patatin-like phospholipase family protein [Dyella monticola]
MESMLSGAAIPAPAQVASSMGVLPPRPSEAVDSNGEPEQKTLGDKRVGLAFSGGGIRSATFSLGVLQRLAMRDMLREIDILSTVSGGGYIGAFLSAWIHRSEKPDDVWDELKRCPENNQTEPAEVQWLRRYSNYLTPRVGVLSLDALTLVATYLRNVALNMSVLIAFVTAMVMVPLLFVIPVIWLLAHPSLARDGMAVFGSIALFACFIQLFFAAHRNWLRLTQPAFVYATVVVPGFLAGLFGGAWLTSIDNSFVWELVCLIFIVVIVLAMAVAQIAFRRPQLAASPPLVSSFRFRVYAPATAVAVIAGFLMLRALHDAWKPVDNVPVDSADLMLTFGAPLLVGVIAISVTLWIGLMGRDYPEMYREWWSRVGGASITMGIVWVAWCALAIYVPTYLDNWLSNIQRLWSIAAGWLASVATVIGLFRSLSGTTSPGKILPKRAVVAAVLASVVLVVLVVAIACGAFALLRTIASLAADGNGFLDVTEWACRPGNSTSICNTPHHDLYFLPAIWKVFLASTVTALLLGWRVDINRFSLHDMYKNRLIRCYLGASNRARKPNWFTGFDPDDDIALADLAPLRGSGSTPHDTSSDPSTPTERAPLRAEPQRPFPIFNATLNLVHGAELAWQERKAALFVLTPTYCGYQLAPSSGNKPLFSVPDTQQTEEAPQEAFRPTVLYADNASRSDRRAYRTAGPQNLPANVQNGERTGFTVGMAMATSGAAVSPNMGANTQPALAMLLTFFNIRLGRWCPNPGKRDWRRASPRSNLAWLLAEASGNTNEQRNFVYLSDGGHFENTAVYELVRRRCSHIVMVDAGADPTRAFEDLGNLIRKVRVDLGAKIDLNLGELYALKSGRSNAGFVRGKVTYATNPERETGKILLIKPTLCKQKIEPADIYNYARGDHTFPQQTTLDQWFDESQFEAYRCLGSLLTEAAFTTNPEFFS